MKITDLVEGQIYYVKACEWGLAGIQFSYVGQTGLAIFRSTWELDTWPSFGLTAEQVEELILDLD